MHEFLSVWKSELPGALNTTAGETAGRLYAQAPAKIAPTVTTWEDKASRYSGNCPGNRLLLFAQRQPTEQENVT